jgi:hypothetical protein
MRALAVLCLIIALALPGTARGGDACRQMEMPPHKVAEAARTALLAAKQLDEVDAPVALIARVGNRPVEAGTGLQPMPGFAVRDHAPRALDRRAPAQRNAAPTAPACTRRGW